MHDQTLLMLATEIRNRTLKLVDGVTPDQAAFTGGRGLNNSILWHAGHALVTVEHLSVSPATDRPPLYPAGWYETFSMKSQPATVTNWPALGDVAAALQEQLGRLTEVLRSLPQERIDQVIDAARNRTLRFSILHGLLDEARHQGEIILLKKLWARREPA
ncbi:MAG: hypothetical protein JWO31_3861 [Phycisphaerales bacterium]|nr:hypothetical protein [Phycisphaerales bacterium]